MLFFFFQKKEMLSIRASLWSCAGFWNLATRRGVYRIALLTSFNQRYINTFTCALSDTDTLLSHDIWDTLHESRRFHRYNTTSSQVWRYHRLIVFNLLITARACKPRSQEKCGRIENLHTACHITMRDTNMQQGSNSQTRLLSYIGALCAEMFIMASLRQQLEKVVATPPVVKLPSCA